MISASGENKDIWKVNVAHGGVCVCHNGYHGTLPCRALWDMSFAGVATQMMYYSSVGIVWCCRRRCYTSILQTFNFCFPSSCSWPGSFGALLWACACFCWPHYISIRSLKGSPIKPPIIKPCKGFKAISSCRAFCPKNTNNCISDMKFSLCKVIWEPGTSTPHTPDSR